MSTATPPLTHVRADDTVRLLPTRFETTSVLEDLTTDADDLAALFDLESATNRRLAGEQGLLPGIGVDELVFAVPEFRTINAAFTYANPLGSRFNGPDRGAWYAGLDTDTSLAEVAFHKSVELAEVGEWNTEVTYREMLADFNTDLHDLRGGDPAYSPYLDPASYVASQGLAETLLAAGSMGVVFPSVRHPGGTCLACFRPALVGNVRRGRIWQLVWEGHPDPEIVEVVDIGASPD